MDRRSVLRLAGGASVSGLLTACAGADPTPSPSVVTSDSPAASSSAPRLVTRTGAFRSRRRNGAETSWMACYPPGHREGDRLPVLITLHGTGAGQDTPEVLRWADNAPVLHREGLPPFVCVGVGGGDTFWHRRRNGDDSGAMVLDELLPLLSTMGLDTRRIGLYGYSMGGVGAIWLASLLGRSRVSAVAISSTPFYPDSRLAGDAYDSDADFRAHDIRSRWRLLEGIPVRVDCGASDQFLAWNKSFVPTAQPRAELHISPGGHDREFWGRVALDQLRFLGRHVARVETTRQ